MVTDWSHFIIFNYAYGNRTLEDYAAIYTGYFPSGVHFTDWQTPICADILGDFREEVIGKTSDGSRILIYTNTEPINTRRVCFLQDKLYRQSFAHHSIEYGTDPYLGGYPMPGAPGNGSISGTISDTAGIGISGIGVELTFGSINHYATTDDSGYYSFEHLCADTYTIVPTDTILYSFTPTYRTAILSTDDEILTG